MGKPTNDLSSADLNMLMKTIQSFVPEFSKLEGGEAATRATRLHAWIISVNQAVNPAGIHLIAWWAWCQSHLPT